MSSSHSHGDDEVPKKFPEVPPTGDLGGYRNTILFALGELTTQVKRLIDDVKEQGTRIDGVRESTSKDFREVKEQLKLISDKILVAETQVKSAFYTSKWFLVAVAAIVGWLAGHWDKIVRVLQTFQTTK